MNPTGQRCEKRSLFPLPTSYLGDLSTMLLPTNHEFRKITMDIDELVAEKKAQENTRHSSLPNLLLDLSFSNN
jgi:hypothetical protein